jgi:predicted deacylase
MPQARASATVTAAGIDLETDGFRAYRVRLPDGRGSHLDLPVIVIRNGSGPSVLLAGGTHGDEFEGQIAVSDLIRNTDQGAVSGLLVALPLHNFEACIAGTRTDRTDGADLNRLFGTDARGKGPSAAVAGFVAETLLPPVDWVVDLHSGGRSHEFVLSSNLQTRPGSREYFDMLPVLLAFDAPYGLIFDEVGGADMPHAGTLEGLARQLGKRAISSEIGGGGRATPMSLAVAERGLRNVLAYIGVRDDERATRPEDSRSALIALTRAEHYVLAPAAGRLAPQRWLGDDVRAGEILGHIHPLEDPLAAPVPIAARSDGVVAAVVSQGVQAEDASLFFIAERLARD